MLFIKIRSLLSMPSIELPEKGSDVFQMISNLNLIDIIRIAVIAVAVLLVWKVASKIIKTLIILGIAVLIFSFFFL